MAYYCVSSKLCKVNVWKVCDSIDLFLLVKLIKFFSLSFYILLPVMVNKDFQRQKDVIQNTVCLPFGLSFSFVWAELPESIDWLIYWLITMY